MFSTLLKAKIKFSVTFVLSSANVFDLKKPIIFSFGNEVNVDATLWNSPPSIYLFMSDALLNGGLVHLRKIDHGQPAQTVKADHGQNFPPLVC